MAKTNTKTPRFCHYINEALEYVIQHLSTNRVAKTKMKIHIRSIVKWLKQLPVLVLKKQKKWHRIDHDIGTIPGIPLAIDDMPFEVYQCTTIIGRIFFQCHGRVNVCRLNSPSLQTYLFLPNLARQRLCTKRNILKLINVKIRFIFLRKLQLGISSLPNNCQTS